MRGGEHDKGLFREALADVQRASIAALSHNDSEALRGAAQRYSDLDLLPDFDAVARVDFLVALMTDAKFARRSELGSE